LFRCPRIVIQQLIQCVCDLGSGEWFRDQQDSSGVTGTKARVSLLRCVTDDDDGELGVIWVVPHRIEQRFAHVEGGTVEHEGIGALFKNQFIYALGISRGEDAVAAVPQRKRQKLGNLGRIVDEQDAVQPNLILAGPGARLPWLLAF